jgi:hypothetical protein
MDGLTLSFPPKFLTYKCMVFLVFLAVAPVIFLGCAHTEQILIPPQVELQAYDHIGVIEFSTNAEDALKPYVTQNFIHAIQSAQPGTRILELGSREYVLQSIKRDKLDLETVKTIGRKFNVDALIIGHLEISGIKPTVKVFTVPAAVHAGAYVEALLSAKLLETDNGATLWTQATSEKTSVARVSLHENGPIGIGVSDPKDKYGNLVPELVYANTMDFRPRYEYIKVK